VAPEREKISAIRGWSSARAILWLAGGQGRPAAIALLALLALFHLLLGEQGWNPVRYSLFDAYQRLMPRKVERYPVIIVDIDDASLVAFGRWPWPRTRLARLTEAAYRLGALAVGLDIVLPEADSLSPDVLFKEREDVSAALHDVLATLSSNDTILAQTLRRIPSVIARAAMNGDEAKGGSMSNQTPIRLVGESPVAHVQSYRTHLANLPELEAAAFGHGYVNDTPDSDGVVRAVPLLIAVNRQLAPAFALELLRVATRQSLYSVHSSSRGVRGVQVGTSFIPTDSDGRIRLHFSPAYAARRVSAGAILRGEVAPNKLAGQVAIVGVTAIGVGDVAATPIATRMDGVDIQAQTIENILDGVRLMRPPITQWLELLALIGIGVVLILLLPRLRPGYGLAIFLAGAALVSSASLVSFYYGKILLDPSFPTAGNVMILMLLLTAGFSAADRRRRELDAALETERIERSRIDGELHAAREIQLGMLPTPGNIEGLPAHLEFHALLEPAQEVGGDLYDAFMLDEQHFFFLVADVSGKGVPASLFMALSKTLCKSLARREHLPLDALVRLVNEEISRENPAMLFLTAIVGIIDVRSGEIELCNAGHDAPILLRANDPPLSLSSPGGPPLCFQEDFPYSFDRLHLQPDDMLVMITDGVTEAQDGNQNLYGLPRALAYLAGMEQRSHNPATICQGLYTDVKRFTSGALPSDDITIMAIRFTAPPAAAATG
jgi:serine phosphatase RsbU (regulator of sigma subunit)